MYFFFRLNIRKVYSVQWYLAKDLVGNGDKCKPITPTLWIIDGMHHHSFSRWSDNLLSNFEFVISLISRRICQQLPIVTSRLWIKPATLKSQIGPAVGTRISRHHKTLTRMGFFMLLRLRSHPCYLHWQCEAPAFVPTLPCKADERGTRRIPLDGPQIWDHE